MLTNARHFWLVGSLVILVAIPSMIVILPDKFSVQSQTNQQVFVGEDNGGDFQRALRAALVKAQEAAGCCDMLVNYRVIDIQGHVGGFAGVDQIKVTILATY